MGYLLSQDDVPPARMEYPLARSGWGTPKLGPDGVPPGKDGVPPKLGQSVHHLGVPHLHSTILPLGPMSFLGILSVTMTYGGEYHEILTDTGCYSLSETR